MIDDLIVNFSYDIYEKYSLRIDEYWVLNKDMIDFIYSYTACKNRFGINSNNLSF